MKRTVQLAGLLLVTIGAARLAVPQDPSFALDLAAPAGVVGTAGDVVQYGVTGQLTTTGLDEGTDGAQGWSLSIAADGGAIVDATTAGTIVDTLKPADDGFELTELTSGADNEGAVSAVVLAFQELVTLPSTGTVDLIALTVEATVPDPVEVDGDEECDPLAVVVSYANGLQGSGQPVDNKITYTGLTFLPAVTDATTTICPKIVKPTNFKVTVQDPPATVGEPVGDTAPITVEVPVGAGLVDVQAGVNLESALPDPDPPTTPPNLGGVQGWSISVATGECFAISDATTAGTAVDDYFNGGFEKTEVVDPAKNSGQQGAVSAVVLSFTAGNTLPPQSDVPILNLAGSLDASGITAPGEVGDPCLLRIIPPGEQGLVGAGQPVATAVTVGGDTKKPGTLSGEIVLAGATEARFVRGNANDDLKIDIADPIWIVNELFREGPATTCQDAADANNDGTVDLTDVVYLIDYEFKGGPMPDAPFPDCGTDPEGDDDGLTCELGQKICQ